MNASKRGLYVTYLSEFAARACCWTLSSQLLMHLIHLHWHRSPQQLYLVGASLSLLFLCTVFGGLVRDKLFCENSVMMLGVVTILIGSISFFLFHKVLYLGLALTFLGAGLVISSTPLVVCTLTKDKQGKAFTVLYGFTNAGVILGAVVGGLLNSDVSWNALIGFNCLVTVLALGMYVYAGWYSHILEITVKKSMQFCAVLLVAVTLAFFYLKYELFSAALLILAIVGYFIFLLRVFQKRPRFRKKLLCALIFIAMAIVFFSGEFQVASTLVGFSKYFVNLKILFINIPAGSIAALESIFVVIGAFVISRIPMIADKLPINRKIFIGLLLGTLAFFSLYLLTFLAKSGSINFTFIVLAFCLLGFGDVFLTPPIMQYVAENAPKDIKGRLIAGTYFSFSIAGYLSGFIGQEISKQFKRGTMDLHFYSTTFMTMMFLIGIACLVSVLMIVFRLKVYLAKK